MNKRIKGFASFAAEGAKPIPNEPVQVYEDSALWNEVRETGADDLRSLIRGFADVEQFVYNITPVYTPFMSKRWDDARIQKRKTGGSMRQRRRAIMKPIRFTPKDKARKIHEWRRDC